MCVCEGNEELCNNDTKFTPEMMESDSEDDYTDTV